MASFQVGNLGNGGFNGKGIYAPNIGIQQMGTLDSTIERQKKQQEAASEVKFWEDQKATLKEKECSSVEEIADKLKQFHSYEDYIDAVKKSYNYEQMYHTLDEAIEQGEKMAEALEKTEPKTEEERKEEAKDEIIEEITGEEVSDGMLSDLLEDAKELTDGSKQNMEALDNLNALKAIKKSEEEMRAVEAEMRTAAESQLPLEGYIPMDIRV